MDQKVFKEVEDVGWAINRTTVQRSWKKARQKSVKQLVKHTRALIFGVGQIQMFEVVQTEYGIIHNGSIYLALFMRYVHILLFRALLVGV
jgi:hypothetical protein